MRDIDDFPEVRTHAPNVLELLSDVHGRLTKVEADNARMRSEIEAAREAGDIDFDRAHVVHVLQKYFPHDMPPPSAPPAPVPQFDAFTGLRLN